ncbi:hypothetical protein V3481_019401 [Fusarium oxysporum f. sp. vasinfectum]
MDTSRPRDDWEELRPDIIQLYNNTTLKGLVKILRGKYNLNPIATEKICRTKLRSWGITTYATKGQSEAQAQHRKRPSTTSVSFQRRQIPRPLMPAKHEPLRFVLFNVNQSLFRWCQTISVTANPSDLGETIASYHSVRFLVGNYRYEEAAMHMRIYARQNLKDLIIYNPPGLSMFGLKIWPIARGFFLEENVHGMNLGELSFLETFLLDMESLTADHYGGMHPICQLIRALMKVSREGLLEALSRVHCQSLHVWQELTRPRSTFAKHPEQQQERVTGVKWKDYIR